jgi:hypothetical protein
MPKRQSDYDPGLTRRSTIIAFTRHVLLARRPVDSKSVAAYLRISRPQAHRYRAAFWAEFPELAAQLMPKGRCIRPPGDQARVNIQLRRMMRFARWAFALTAPATIVDIAKAMGVSSASAYVYRSAFHAAAPDLGQQLLPYTQTGFVPGVAAAAPHVHIVAWSTRLQRASLRWGGDARRYAEGSP